MNTTINLAEILNLLSGPAKETLERFIRLVRSGEEVELLFPGGSCRVVGSPDEEALRDPSFLAALARADAPALERGLKDAFAGRGSGMSSDQPLSELPKPRPRREG